MGKNKHAKRKQYLGNVDVPLSKSNANVMKTFAFEDLLPPPPKSILKQAAQTKARESKPPAPSSSVGAETSTSASQPNTTKYKQPELHSMLDICNQIETVKQLEPPPVTSIGQLTPLSKKLVNAQITKQLNHQYDQVVFKRLAPVNVNDSVLIPMLGARKTTAPANAKSKYVSKEKDPEPTLSDYLCPILRLPYEFKPQVPPQPLARVASGPAWNNFSNIEYVLRILDEH
uniref:Protein phosphatase 1 regulatory subunit 35 C-terminal domain-containing protein n=1 Tax=Anopheles dirus TaxID=7168 RepID=A0A182NB12_9DIPT